MMARELVSFGTYGTKFQELLIQILVDDRSFADQIGEVLEFNYFESKYLQKYAKKLYEYKQKYSSHPTRDVLSMIVRTEFEEESELLKKQIREFHSRLLTTEENAEGREYVKSISLEFCKKQALKEAMLKSVKLMKEKEVSYDQISKIINDSLVKGLPNDQGMEWIIDFEDRYQPDTRKVITTGWDVLDGITGGGLGKGEAAVIIAPSGIGKSQVLVSLGAAALKAGKTVLHVTLELSESQIGLRYDSNITGIPVSELVSHKEEVKQIVGGVKGKLLLKFFPMYSITYITLKHYLEKLIKKGINFDLVIVDYADLLNVPKKNKELYIDYTDIYNNIKALAQTFQVPIYTASQCGRQGLNSEFISMDLISGAWGKIFTLDLVMSFSRTMKDKSSNAGRLAVLKSRLGVDGVVYPAFVDFASSTIRLFPANTEETIEDLMKDGLKEEEKRLKDKYKNFRKEKGKVL